MALEAALANGGGPRLRGYREVIIIGAARSGTNMLRGVLCRLPGFGTWPCDEINAVWRHGNTLWPSDELPAELATDGVRAYLNRQFARRARVGRLGHVVEKTCANSLRVPFVDRVLPRARYLFIYRDALDAVASAIKRWRAPLDLPYTIRKARFVPLTDFPYYGWRFVMNRIHRLRPGERRLALWGPQPNGMSRWLEAHSLPETCALQWNACVKLAATAFRRMPRERVLPVSYEQFVASPQDALASICAFLEVTHDRSTLNRSVQAVFDTSVGQGGRGLDRSVQERIAELTATARAALADLLSSRPPAES